ncbi:predicted protein [Phaeodactylum tricornutum CCAP 1055/1]|uniref:Uncharacterized protein n=1 Tax=Phaeodactylum tricornutum (strain CCAP 1055/1) TaxID=556484 RepID=B7S4B9_PHATC|nr:predicted protein [Phaeodactylum tricornutum CCAP 1055/1]EEC42663.1 predicted protein [Phaeodactylum tricornutum CCAP 1055/1]|eukprot:XP_002176427.1 predicted protein [Phaeodactylum tricornutum CCAP 1055/1]
MNRRACILLSVCLSSVMVVQLWLGFATKYSGTGTSVIKSLLRPLNEIKTLAMEDTAHLEITTRSSVLDVVAYDNWTASHKITSSMQMTPQDSTQASKFSLMPITKTKAEEKKSLATWQHTHQNRPFCSVPQIRDGQWVPVHGPASYITQTSHLRCYGEPDVYQTMNFTSYVWQPHNAHRKKCEWTAWQGPRNACQVLEHSNILIAGDSLSWEHFSSLLQLLGHHVHQNLQHQSRELRTNVMDLLCNGRSRISYRRDDKLTNLSAALDEEPFPNVVILNRGAHYVGDDELMQGIRENIRELKVWKRQCNAMGMSCQLFWRTSVPGHPECHKFEAPVNDLQRMEAHISNLSLYNNHTLKYHWYDYQHQNQLVIEEFAKHNATLEVHIMDAYALNVLRPDDHRSHQGDCLHNCYPGKMDVYNVWLLHVLRQLFDLESIKKQSSIAASQGWHRLPATVYNPDATDAARLVRLSRRGHNSDSKQQKQH